MSSQIIPLKDRTDLRESSRILALETIRVELRRAPCASNSGERLRKTPEDRKLAAVYDQTIRRLTMLARSLRLTPKARPGKDDARDPRRSNYPKPWEVRPRPLWRTWRIRDINRKRYTHSDKRTG
jgi:hypothetical protein